MAKDGAEIVDKVVLLIPGAEITSDKQQWIIPIR
jgi:hypothetical protein